MELEPVSSGFRGGMVVTVKSLHPSLHFDRQSPSPSPHVQCPLSHCISREKNTVRAENLRSFTTNHSPTNRLLVYLLGLSKGPPRLRSLLPSSPAFSVKVKGPALVTVSANLPNNSTAGTVCLSLFLSLNLALHGNGKASHLISLEIRNL